MARQKPRFNPDHPFEPQPPTPWNRLVCRVMSHFWEIDTIDYYANTVSLICLRCSRIWDATVRGSTLGGSDPTFEPKYPRVIQQ